MTEDKQTCETCRFFDPRPIEDKPYNGLCRHDPPEIFSLEKGEWPVVTEDDWCGKWVRNWKEGQSGRPTQNF